VHYAIKCIHVDTQGWCHEIASTSAKSNDSNNMAEKGRFQRGASFILFQDMILSIMASLLSILIVRWVSEAIPGFTVIALKWLMFSLVFSLIGFLVTQSHKVVRRWATMGSITRLMWAIVIKEALLSLCVIFGVLVKEYQSPQLKVLLIISDVFLTAAFLFYMRFAARVFSKSENHNIMETVSRKNALVLGTSNESVSLANGLETTKKYNVVGFITSDPDMNGMVIADKIVYLCKDKNDIRELEWRLGGIDCIFFPKGEVDKVDSSGSDDDGLSAGNAAGNSDVKSEGVSSSGDRPVSDGMSLMGKFIKRSFDIVVSGILLIVFSPLWLISAILIKKDDGGPVFFRQERVGLGGKHFEILKFRSMRLDAEVNGAQLYSGDDDPRLTKVGGFLRRHHLDELPQLWNVFRGDMSFIGYRPERPFYIEKISQRNPRYRYLFQIRPGVTSYATLYNGYTDTMEKMLTRLDLDLYYLRNHSLWFDMKILMTTFLKIVSGKEF